MARKTLQQMGDGVVAKIVRFPVVTETPEAVPGHAQVYAKAGVLHLQDETGVEHILAETVDITEEIAEAIAAAAVASAGTAETGFTAAEAGNAVYHRTTLTVDTVLPAIAGGANLGVGVLAYTFPAGRIVIHASSIDLAIQQTEENITADTPEIGLGTTIASGAVAVLSGTAAFENILTGQVAADCDGTPTLKTLATVLVLEAADDHTVHINVADGWAADGDAAAALTGSVVLVWSLMG